ncbi:MAG: hypothetical protein AB7O97_16465 [Planctomycetota bacterium]
MRRIALLTLAAAAVAPLTAQSNTVAGLDGRLSDVNSLTDFGRRGVHPNGEAGMAMLNTMCNPGSINIPWQSAGTSSTQPMNTNHPKFGFIIARESNGRFEQINEWSWCKHAFTSTNFSGACGTCISPGTGQLMGINCSDTYGAGNNASRTWLGPPQEIDPWLGTWNPINSYFDRGDPDVGAPNNSDGVRSSAGGWDAVDHRVTVDETDMLVPGASYYYGIHLIHEGEAVANRGDNFASRGFAPSWNGSSWSYSNTAGMTYGSILTRWSGASFDLAGNGNDDGRFAVAVKITPNGGSFHYEYAIHNMDNSRAGAVFRIPVDAGASVSGIGFGDIDTNALNDWSGARVGNEIVFTAPANNPLEWNTFYNVWFDCDVAPSNGLLHIDQARVGPGNLTVSVPAQVPSGIPTAFNTSVGVGCTGTSGPCQASVYEFFNTPAAFDLAGSSMGLSLSGSDYTLGAATGTFVTPTGTNLNLGDDTQATVNLPFTLSFPGGSTTSLAVCSNGFISPTSNGTDFSPTVGEFLGGGARWAAAYHDLNPQSVGQVLADVSPTAVRISWVGVPSFSGTSSHTFQYEFLPNNQVNIYWQTMQTSGNEYLVGWTAGNDANDPGNTDMGAAIAAGSLSLCPGAVNVLPVSLDANARPVLGTTVQMTTSNIPAGSVLSGLLYSVTQATPPIDLTSIGMEGCFAHVINPTTWTIQIGPGATAVDSIPLPNAAAFVGVAVTWQSLTLSPGTTSSGFLSSNGLVTLLAAQ